MSEQGTQLKKQIVLDQLADGATIVEACQAASISRSAYYKWMNSDTEFAAAAVDAELSGVVRVEGNLVKAAEGGFVTETKTEYVEIPGGAKPVKKITETRKYIPASVAAQIFYLCNRNPQRWSNSHKLEVSQAEPVQILFEEAQSESKEPQK